MISYLVKGRTLENKHGSLNFALLLAFLCVATPIMYVCLAVASSNLFDDKDIMRSCAIGFSGVIFALKLITTVEENGESYIGGFLVPVRYSAWVELIAIHILVPNASFMGHLAGILVGFLYMKTYLGTLVDCIITSITGQRMRHNHRRSGGSSSSWFSSSGYSTSGTRGWSDRRVPGYEDDYEDTYNSDSFYSRAPPYRDSSNPNGFYPNERRAPPQPGWRF